MDNIGELRVHRSIPGRTRPTHRRLPGVGVAACTPRRADEPRGRATIGAPAPVADAHSLGRRADQGVTSTMDLMRALAPPHIAHAHCDIPCGVYDPAQARIEAESCYRIIEKYLASSDE